MRIVYSINKQPLLPNLSVPINLGIFKEYGKEELYQDRKEVFKCLFAHLVLCCEYYWSLTFKLPVSLFYNFDEKIIQNKSAIIEHKLLWKCIHDAEKEFCSSNSFRLLEKISRYVNIVFLTDKININ